MRLDRTDALPVAVKKVTEQGEAEGHGGAPILALRVAFSLILQICLSVLPRSAVRSPRASPAITIDGCGNRLHSELNRRHLADRILRSSLLVNQAVCG